MLMFMTRRIVDQFLYVILIVGNHTIRHLPQYPTLSTIQQNVAFMTKLDLYKHSYNIRPRGSQLFQSSIAMSTRGLIRIFKLRLRLLINGIKYIIYQKKIKIPCGQI